MPHFVGVFLLAYVALAGCDVQSQDSVTGNQVSVDFLLVNSSDTATPVQAARHSAGLEKSLVFVDDRAALTITDIRLVASRFVLEARKDACVSGTAGCAAFRPEPFLVDLPLDENPLTVATGTAQPDSYANLRFDVMRIASSTDPSSARDVRDLQRSIRRSLGEWPDEAVMLVTGAYTPIDGDPRPFKAFFDAGFTVSLTLEPQLTIAPTAETRSVTVRIDPNHWFRDTNGNLRDLSAYDYGQTASVASLPEMTGRAFVEARIEP